MSGTRQGNGLALTVGANIRRARLEKGWTQRELALHAGKSSQNISDWERGANRPHDKSLILLADVFGKDFAWFFIPADPDLEHAA